MQVAQDLKSDRIKPSPDDSSKPAAEAAPAPKRWPLLVAAIVTLAFVGGVLWLIFVPKADVTTNDAYVHVHYATIAPRVAGQITGIAVDNDKVVRQGDLLFQLDDRDYVAAEQLAEANLDSAKAMLANAADAIPRQNAEIARARKQLTASQARLKFAQQDAARYNDLAATGYGTVQNSQRSTSDALQNSADVDAAQSSVDVAEAQIKVLLAEQKSAEAKVKASDATLRQAKLNLSYTKIYAPVDGMIAQRSVQVGDVTSAGTTAMVVVPLQESYIEANFLETQLRHVRAGQPATFHVDALNISLDGKVNAVPAASATTFSPIAPTDATGNFTKIVQRLPVRIDILPDQPTSKLLRIGLSVEVTIHTKLDNIVATDSDGALAPQ